MRVAFCVVLCFSVSSAFGQQAVGSEPSAMEVFAKRHGVRMVWSSEITQWKADSTALVITALVLEDTARSSQRLRGVKFEC